MSMSDLNEYRERVAEALARAGEPEKYDRPPPPERVAHYWTTLADALLAPGGVVVGLMAEALRAAADEWMGSDDPNAYIAPDRWLRDRATALEARILPPKASAADA